MPFVPEIRLFESNGMDRGTKFAPRLAPRRQAQALSRAPVGRDRSRLATRGGPVSWLPPPGGRTRRSRLATQPGEPDASVIVDRNERDGRGHRWGGENRDWAVWGGIPGRSPRRTGGGGGTRGNLAGRGKSWPDRRRDHRACPSGRVWAQPWAP